MNGSLVFEEWAEGTCTYKCQPCGGTTFLGRAKFSRHLDTDHDTDILAYLNKHGEALTCRMTVGCGLCGAQVLHDRSVLQDHLGTCHSGFDLFRYYRIYVNKRVVAIRKRKSQSQEELGVVCPSEKIAKPIVSVPEEAMPTQVCDTFNTVAQVHPVVGEHDSDIIVSASEDVLSAKKYPELTYSSVFQTDSPCHEGHVNGTIAQAEESHEELSRQIEEDILSNRCEFACSECPVGSQFKTDSMSKLVKHIFYEHKTAPKDRIMGRKRHIHMATKIVKYTCVICSRKMLHDRRVIRQHMLKVHNMQKNEYSRVVRAGKNDGVSNQLKGDDVNISQNKKLIQENKCVTFSQSKNDIHEMRDIVRPVSFIGKTVEPGKISDEETTTVVANLCTFKCDICQETKYSWSALRQHVKIFHMLSSTFMPKYIQEIRYHQCKLCQFSVICDVLFLRNHVLSKHKMSIKDYTNLDEKNVKNDVRVHTSLSVGIEHEIEKTHLKVPKTKRLSCNRDELKALVPQVPFVGKTVDPGEISLDQTTTSTANLCVFKCDICQEIKLSWATLRNHLKSSHSLESCPFFPKYIVETRYHRCKLCQSCIVCDVDFLHAHLLGRHKKTALKDYRLLAENEDVKSSNESKEAAEWMPNIAGVESQAVDNKEPGNMVDADLSSTAHIKTEETPPPRMPTIIRFSKKLHRDVEADPLSI